MPEGLIILAAEQVSTEEGLLEALAEACLEREYVRLSSGVAHIIRHEASILERR